MYLSCFNLSFIELQEGTTMEQPCLLSVSKKCHGLHKWRKLWQSPIVSIHPFADAYSLVSEFISDTVVY